MAFTPLPRIAFGKPANGPDGKPVGPVKLPDLIRQQQEAKLAAEVLPDLPDDGHAVHVLLNGRFDLSAVIAKTVQRWPVERLTVATLSANKKSLRELLNELDAGTVGTLTALTSGFFARHNREMFLAFGREIRDDYPGSVLAFGKSHCKVALFEFRDGSCPLVMEGSANLRSNDSLEQLACVRNRALADFHRQWIDRLVKACHLADLERDDTDAADAD